MMIPTPKKAQVIEVMEKSLCSEIIQWLVPETIQILKDKQEHVKLKRYQLQPLYHLLMTYGEVIEISIRQVANLRGQAFATFRD